jgi:hypothetical protein
LPDRFHPRRTLIHIQSVSSWVPTRKLETTRLVWSILSPGMQEDTMRGYQYAGSWNSISELSLGSIVMDPIMLGMVDGF